MSKTVTTLASALEASVVGDGDVEITDVVHDHRQCVPGAMFVARRGLTVDGHDFVGDAGECSAVCVEQPMDGVDVPQLIVADTSAALGQAASAVHGAPFSELRAAGITGTNGKTMVTRLIGSIVEASGGVPAIAGTLGWRAGDAEHPLARTSPESSDLHRMAAAMVEAGADIAAFEVSSHALRLNRVAGARFAVTGFTNLSADHLDFHADMEDYFDAKTLLFTPELTDEGVVWIDDVYGARLAEVSDVPVTTVGSEGDIAVSDLEPSLAGTTFGLRLNGEARSVRLPLPGVFNVANAAMAAAVSHRLGVDTDAIVGGLEQASGVPGRFQVVSDDAWPMVAIVDYAHTPEGIANAVASASELTAGRVIVVVGAGGDRDVTKRPEMGRAASQADRVVITTDNPRSEDPARIAHQVAGGVDAGVSSTTILDRREAIGLALEEAEAGDIVLVLGKGHEQGQEFADRTEPFDDVAVVREMAASL